MTWWRRLLGKADLERQLDAELRDHVERLSADYVREGLSGTDARRRALLAFGSLEGVKEGCRDARGTRWVEEFVGDLRYAARLLRRHPTFSAVAILSLALGIGANAAIFSLVDAVLLKTLPVREPTGLVLLRERAGSRETFSWSVSQFHGFEQSETLAGLCAFRPRLDFNLMTAAGPESASGQLVSGSCFDVLGVPMALGRTLTSADDIPEAQPVAIIGYDFWKRHFSADPAIVGRIVHLQERPFTIVGVTTERFLGLEAGRAVDVSIPLSFQPALGRAPLLASPNVRWLRLIGRLHPGVSRERAAADLERRRVQLAQSASRRSEGARLDLLSGSQGLNDLREQFSLSLRLLMAAVGLLLLIVCVNLAGLMLAHARAREHELGLRLALGATRHRIVRQLLTESLLLSLMGATAGLLLGSWGSRAVVALLSRGRSPIRVELTLDIRLLAFTIGVTLLASLVFGIWPAFSAARVDPLTRIQAGTRTATGNKRLRSGLLIAVQSGLSAVLIVAAMLFTRTLMKLHSFDIGFDKNQVVLFGVRPGMAGYDPTRSARLFRDLYGSLSASPGVQSVTLLMDVPLGGVSYTAGISVPGRPADDEMVNYNFVGPRFCETMGIPILAGRDLQLADDASSRPVAIVSQAVAAHYFPDRSAIGAGVMAGNTLVEIVGVVKDVPYEGVRASKGRIFYRPWMQDSRATGAPTFAVRSSMSTAALSDLVRRRVRETAPTVPVYSMTTLDAQFDQSIATERLMANISAFFGLMALLLVATGVYGMLANAIASRTRELGIRLAVGATRGQVATLVIAGALAPVCIGLIAGAPLASAASRTARGMLFGIDVLDPVAYGLSAAALLVVALLAAAIPVRSALKADPMVALREP